MSQGNATLIRRTIDRLQEGSPEEFKRVMASGEWLELGLRAFHTRLERAERDATLAWLEMRGVLGSPLEKALLMWLASKGIESVELADQLLSMAQRAISAKDSDAYRLAKRLVRERVMADPDERRRVMQEVFGTMEAPAALTNGHANGSGTP